MTNQNPYPVILELRGKTKVSFIPPRPGHQFQPIKQGARIKLNFESQEDFLNSIQKREAKSGKFIHKEDIENLIQQELQ